MNNHTNTPAKDRDVDKNGVKNTIFTKKETLCKKRPQPSSSKAQNNSEEQIKKVLSSVLDPSAESCSPEKKIFATTTQKTHTNTQNEKLTSSKRYQIDSLSDSDEEEQEVDDEDGSYMVLSLQDIIKSIPQNANKTPSTELQKTHTEWRWRFFDLRGRKLIEISKMAPGTNRVYMDNRGKWTEYSLKKEWDKFIVDTRYCYVQK